MKPIKLKDLEDPFSRKNMKEFNKRWKETFDSLMLEWIKEFEEEKKSKKRRRKKKCSVCGSKTHEAIFHGERCPNGYR